VRRERWYDVKGYEGTYQASSLGRVRALARIDAAGNRRSLKVLRLHRMQNGRLFLNLCKDGIATGHCVSVLLAAAYGIPNRRRCGYVIHLNHDNGDFRRRNLAWATLAEQRMHDGHKVNCRYYGVTCNAKRTGVLRWVAVLRLNYQRHDLGQFATPQEAAYAYDREVKRLSLERPLNQVKRPKNSRPEVPSLLGEIWRALPHARDTHQISNFGRVRTMAYVTTHGRRVLPRLRKIQTDVNGCRTVLVRGRRFAIVSMMKRVFPGLTHETIEARQTAAAKRRVRHPASRRRTVHP